MDKTHLDKTHRTLTSKHPKLALRLGLAAAALAVVAGAASPASAEPRPERSLAGIAIFAPGSEVTRKFGNPSQILVGGAAPSANTPGSSSGSGSSSGGSGGYPGSQSSSQSSTGQLPGFPGQGNSSSGYPGSGGGLPGQSSGFPGGGVTAPPVKPPVTLIYNRANGGTLEFTISPDKRVIQIRETGYTGAYGTARGIKLGTSYSAVVAKYGYQENTAIAGSVIDIDYKDTLHCGFQFLAQKLVGIIVASPD